MRTKKARRPIALHDSPLQYAPENELGVVFLFAHVAQKLQFKIERIRPQYPDCTAYKKAGNVEKRVRIELNTKPQISKHTDMIQHNVTVLSVGIMTGLRHLNT